MSIEDAEDDRDPKEIEREKYGDRTNNFDLFGAPIPGPIPPSDEDAFNDAAAAIEDVSDVVAETTDLPVTFAAHAAAFHESPVTPELSALEIVPLDGIRDKKVKEIALEVAYPRMSEDTVKKIREIVEEHAGEIPVTITLVELPPDVAKSVGQPQMRLKVNHHFRVQPGPELNAALLDAHASARYVF